jgi:hypothetical protein
MRVVALAIIGAAALLAGSYAYLWRYEVQILQSAPDSKTGSGGLTTYLLRDRWSRTMRHCIRDDANVQPTPAACGEPIPTHGGAAQ